MADTISYRFRIRRRTSASWTSLNEILLNAEMGWESDTNKIKIGDGVTAWNALPYFSVGVQAPVVNATASGTVTPNCTAANRFEYTVTGNLIVNALSNAKPGDEVVLVFTIDGFGGHTLTLDGSYIVLDDVTPELTANSLNLLRCYISSSGTPYCNWHTRAGGGAGTWTPGDLAVLPELWLSDSSSVTDDGTGLCSQWNDASGNNHHFVQTTAANRPVITANAQNFRRVLTFDGSTDFLNGTATCAALTNNVNALTTFVIANPTIASSTFKRLVTFSIGASGNTSARASIGLISGLIEATQRRSDSDSASNAAVTHSSKAYRIHEAEHDWNAQTVTMRLDGSFTPTVTNTAQGVGNTSATNSTEVTLGGTASVGGQCSATAIGEVIVLGYIPTLDERQKIEGYLAWNWGLVANLPAAHPYKAARP